MLRGCLAWLRLCLTSLRRFRAWFSSISAWLRYYIGLVAFHLALKRPAQLLSGLVTFKLGWLRWADAGKPLGTVTSVDN